MKALKAILLDDLDERKFADIYAQTITYGLFAARLHDKTLEDFSRQEAKQLIPRSNPFLKKFFTFISDEELDVRLSWVVDDLCEIFRATDLNELLKDFGKQTGQNDPFIHFYETFLAEYDSRLRKKRGVYYTPEPVVNFIVRAVDDILKNEFAITNGLADTSQTPITVESTRVDARTKSGYKAEKIEVHKVQILDPATGTGTFLAETVKHIYKQFEGQAGIWKGYVEQHLLPRLNGFEVLMAPYTMCHLKLEMLLRETGCQPTKRFKVYLNNSLEEAQNNTTDLPFASWLSHEANEANEIKRDTPVMVVIGNPPYSGESQNKGGWIMNLMDDYKKEPGGIDRLKEKKF